MPSTALVIQCFIKLDTLKGLCESLLRCDGHEDLDLIFWCDSALNSRNPECYKPMQVAVIDFLQTFMEDHLTHFKSIKTRLNEVNQGPCKTCQIALDFAFLDHDFAVFAEDDVLFAADALRWFEAIRGQGLLQDDRYWAVTGESIFFNAEHRALPEGWRDEMLSLAVREDLVEYYIHHNFLPSTCFATSREKWMIFGSTRGQPLGDVDVCQRCAAEDRHGIFPVVPRVKDVGMLHDDGFSVSIHTAAGVSEIKNTYLMSDDLPGTAQLSPGKFREYKKSAGELFTQSTKLTRLPQAVSRPNSDMSARA